MSLQDAEEYRSTREAAKIFSDQSGVVPRKEHGADDDREDKNLSPPGEFQRDSFLEESSQRDLEMFNDTMSLAYGATTQYTNAIFSSCPEMPTQTDMLSTSDRVELVLRRTKAFSEDSDILSRRRHSMDISNNSRSSFHRFRRIDSQLIDSKLSSDSLIEESPRATWVYWEEEVNQASTSLPFQGANIEG